MDYEPACQLQISLSRHLLNHQEFSGYLLFLEHPHTITFGYSLKGDEGKNHLRVSEEFLKKRGVKIFRTDRGGKATYHGPGQLIIYPILNLNQFRLSAKAYVGKLEQCVINWLWKLGLDADRDPDYPGVWIGDKKIASVGVRIENRVSRHGIAVNLWPDLSYFNYIVPCGIPERELTSYLQLTGKRLELKQALSGLGSEFEQVFEMKLKAIEQEMLINKGGWDDDQGMADAGAV